MYTVGSLFAGIGGICLGFEQAGAKVIWANEIDKNACITYKTNFNDVNLIQGDIMDLDAKTLPKVDIIVGGFPCQPFSIAGFQKGFEDERGNLFFEVLRFISDIKPKAFLLENVKNLVSHDKGNTLKVIKECLKEEGYHIDYKVINTCEYGGIPQNRERIYIVGFKEESDLYKFNFPQKINCGKKILDIVDINTEVDKKYYYNNAKCYDILKENMNTSDTLYQWRRVYVRENKNRLCPTLTANMGTGGHNVPLIKDSFDIRKLTPKECLLFQGFPEDYKLPNISDSHIYKQAGNAVSVPVVKRIANNILYALDEN